MSARHGGPAFPTLARMGVDEDSGNKFHEYVDEGMTLRDYFAAQAISHFAHDAASYGWDRSVLDDAARYAYDLADAMLKAREAI